MDLDLIATAAKIAAKNYFYHWNLLREFCLLNRSCLLISGIAIISGSARS